MRVLLFNEIEKIEVAFRAAVVNTITDRTGDIFWMTNPAYVNAGTLALIQREYAHSTEDFIVHFKNIYTDPYLSATSPGYSGTFPELTKKPWPRSSTCIPRSLSPG